MQLQKTNNITNVIGWQNGVAYSGHLSLNWMPQNIQFMIAEFLCKICSIRAVKCAVFSEIDDPFPNPCVHHIISTFEFS